MAPKRDPARRKEEIFKVAIKCFNKKGYYRTSIDMIAAKLGLTKGAVYWYFKSKEKLFIELFHYTTIKQFEAVIEFISTQPVCYEEMMEDVLGKSGKKLFKNFLFGGL